MRRSLMGRRVGGIGFVALAVAMTASSSFGQLSASLLTNGDFEAGTNGDYVPSPWAGFNAAYLSNEYAHNGSVNSLKIFGPFGKVGEGAGANQTLPTTPGQTYQFTGFALSPASDHITGNNFALAQLKFFNGATELTDAEQSVRFDSTMSGSVTDWTPFTMMGTAPANATNVQVQVVHVQQNTPVTGGAIYWDDFSLTVVQGAPTWALAGGGDWNTTSSWTGGIPNSTDAKAVFGSSITADATVTANAVETVGTLTFDNAAHSYTVGGTGSITADVATGQAAINVNSGSHTINVPLTLADSTTATVASGSTLTISKPITISAGNQFSTAGAGTIVIGAAVSGGAGSSIAVTAGTLRATADLGSNTISVNGGAAQFAASQHLNSLSIATGGTAVVSDVATRSVLRTGSLAVAGTGKLDLADNALVVDYSSTSPFTNVKNLVTNGYNTAGSTHWTGSGIVSSNAAAGSSFGIGVVEANSIGITSTGTFLGESVDSSTVLARYTYLGDTNLDGAVNFGDLLSLAKNYGVAGTWVNGDSNYDGTVNFNDLLALAKNYNATLSADQASALGASFTADFALAQSLAPEPATLGAILAVAGSVLTRRRRRLA